MSRSEANKKREKAIDTKFETTTKEPEVKAEENTKKEKKHFLKFKMTPAERMTKLATLNARTYIFLKGMGIVNKKLNAKVNGEVQPNGKPWFNDKSATETKEEEKASPILNTVPTTTEVVKKDTQKKQEETAKKTESTQQDSVKTKQPTKEEKKDKEEPKVVEVKEDENDDEIDYLPETEMEKVLKPKKNYRKNGKKARKAAMEAAKKSA